jgi:hypothetical protein
MSVLQKVLIFLGIIHHPGLINFQKTGPTTIFNGRCTIIFTVSLKKAIDMSCTICNPCIAH